jgi:putative transcriptional regulator
MGKNKIKHKYLFMSIKPVYAYKLIQGTKDIELRKTRPHVSRGDYAIIYASSPVKAVIGFGKIRDIIICPPINMWEKYSDRLGIDELSFKNYYKSSSKAIGIEFDFIRSIAPISLAKIRSVDPNFHPPQIYHYVDENEIQAILPHAIKN